MPTSSPSTPSRALVQPHGRLLALVVFRIDDADARYALSLAAVERVFSMVAVSPLPKAPAVVIGVVNIRGSVIPVLDVRRRFGLAPREWGTSAHLLVARTPRRTVALPVDEVLGVVEVAVEAVTAQETVVPKAEYVSGIAALPDGLLFIHDLDAFLSLDEEERLDQALGEVEA